MRTTFADLKASRIPEVLNINPTDTRLLQYTNEATQRLIQKGHWWGTTAKYTIQASAGLVTMPCQVATIEKVALSNQTIPLRDEWFEFLENGWGTRDDADAGTGQVEALYRGNYPVFSDIVAGSKKVNLICDLASDANKQVLVLGYDDDANWIRTDQSGVISDGELITLEQTPGQLSTKVYAKVTDIQAPDDLDGQWWMYEYDTTTTVQRMIGHYEYHETRPSYARYLFPSIGSTATQVDALVKLAYVPVRQDNDYLLIGNIPAMKKMCQAVKAEEEGRMQDALVLEAQAVAILNEELDHHLGAGRNIGINVVGSRIQFEDPIESFQ